MTEYTINRESAERDWDALRAILDNDGIVAGDVEVLEQIAATIRRAIPKPIPTERSEGDRAAELEMYQAARDRVLKTCQAVRDRVGPSGMINASQIMGLLSLTWPDGNYCSPQSDAMGALPTSPSPEVGVATSPPVASPGPAPDGFCTCYPEGPAKDCGIGQHRDQARAQAKLGESVAYNNGYETGAGDRAQAYRTGNKGTRERNLAILRDLKAGLITAPEKNAIDKALALIAADAENTVTGRGFPS